MLLSMGALACVAGGFVRAGSKVLAAENAKASGEAASEMRKRPFLSWLCRQNL